jgi:GNAT superfamily N-acetyltransferase
LAIATTEDSALLAAVTGIHTADIAQRIERGHVAWVARLAGETVGWGWCATRELSIGELGIDRPLPPGQRYLWDFFTVPRWRGRGIYPRLLQTIAANEPEVERFWVGHDLGNTPSARGIGKAGFREIGVLYRLPEGAFALVPTCQRDIALEAATLFGVGIADDLSDVASPASDDR